MKQNDAAQLLDEAHRLGFELRRDGDRLHVEGPENEAWFVEKLAEAKPQLLDALAEVDRVRVLVLLPQPYPHESENDAPEDGGRIIEAVEAAGGWVRIEDGRIVLRWYGDFPGEVIDRIRAARPSWPIDPNHPWHEG